MSLAVRKATGAIKSLNYGNGLQLNMGYTPERNHPATLKVHAIGNANANRVLDYSYSYTYLDNGVSYDNNRIRQITDNLDNNYTVSYGYDKYNRLSYAAASAYNNRYYQYDAWGNLKKVDTTAGNLYTVNYSLSGVGSGSSSTSHAGRQPGSTVFCSFVGDCGSLELVMDLESVLKNATL